MNGLMNRSAAIEINRSYHGWMPNEVSGKSMEERFADMLLDRIGCYEEDYVSLQDLDDELYRKTGLRVEDIKQRKGRGRRQTDASEGVSKAIQSAQIRERY